MILTTVGVLALLGARPVFPAADELAPPDSHERVLSGPGSKQDLGSPLWWLAQAEKEAELWGNADQRSYSYAEIAERLADRDRIEAAEAVAKRIKRGPARLSARYRIAAAHARAGRLQAVEALARLASEPDGRTDPGAYVQIYCHAAVALANIGRPEEAERICTTLGRRPPDWKGQWEPRGDLVSVKARIEAAVAAAHAKAGRRDDYRKHIQKSEALAKSIPGDVNKMWAEMLSSSGVSADDPPGPNPLNAIYKTNAVRGAVLARAEAGDYRGARKILEVIPPGRSRDTIARILVEALAQSGALKEARTTADSIETRDHRGLADLSLLAAYARTGDLAAAEDRFGRIRQRDRRVVAQLHLALARGGSGEAGDYRAILETAARGVRPKTFGTLARVQMATRDHAEVLKWIRALPRADSRFYGYLDAAQAIPFASASASGSGLQ
jgi:tetratricopeptide (TPR) repeat protein